MPWLTFAGGALAGAVPAALLTWLLARRLYHRRLTEWELTLWQDHKDQMRERRRTSRRPGQSPS